MRKITKIALVVALIYILISSMAYLFQEKLIFLPTQLTQDYEYTFEAPFEEIFIDAEDGARLNAVHFKVDNPNGVILYFHGNAGDLSKWGEICSFFTELQYDVLVMDYRTYGKSTGSLSEKAIYADAELFYDYLLARYDENQIHVYGRSLGTGIATYIASQHQPKQLILETPYYSIADIAKKRFPFFPVKQLLQYHFPSYKFMDKVNCRVTIFHGTSDLVVAYDSGKKLSKKVKNGLLNFVTIEDGSHNNLNTFDAYQTEIKTLLK